MQKTALPLVACLLAIAAAGASAQTVYKWRDAAGQFHISDTPPPPDAKDVVSRKVVPVGAPAASSAPLGAADGELQRKKAKADQDKATAAAAEKARAEQKNADARAQNCGTAREQARTLQSGMRVARINAKGEREYLDDAAIAAQTRQAQQAISQNCGAPAN
ncbi:MAG: DUF4124 domain-containing protein [Burkholderiaceae bacterium]